MQQLAPLDNFEEFESLICDLFNKLYSTNDFIKFGKQGNSQKGIDIFSSKSGIVIQCKKKDLSRSKTTLKNEILKEIEIEIESTQKKNLKIQFNKFYFVSTYDDSAEIIEFCEELKRMKSYDFEIIYWGWQTLTNKIISLQEILNKYWSNFIIEKSNSSQNLSNFSLRKKLIEDFSDWQNISFENRKRNSKMLIRKFDSNQYPFSNKIDLTIQDYTWFAAEFNSIVFDGIEFIISIKNIYINENFEWSYKQSNNFSKLITVQEIGKISFEDIKDYDVAGDEYYNYPHFLCDFKYNGKPFSKTYFQDVNKTYITFEIK